MWHAKGPLAHPGNGTPKGLGKEPAHSFPSSIRCDNIATERTDQLKWHIDN